eukprot:g1428.t1
MALSSVHPMKTSSQSAAAQLKRSLTVQQRSFSPLKKSTEAPLRGPRLPTQHRSICKTTREVNRVMCSASYPYSSGPWSRQSYGYYPTNPQNFQQQETTESNRPFADWIKTITNCSSFVVTALTRCVARVAPQGTSKDTIRTGVKAGLVLLALVFARSILSLLIAVGSVGVLMFVGSKFMAPPAAPKPRPYPQDPHMGPYPRRYYQPGVYYTPGTIYPPPGVYEPMDSGVIDPWTADVLTVWREPVQPQMVTPNMQYQQLNYYSRFGYNRSLDQMK